MSSSWIKKLNEDNGRLHKEATIRQALVAANLGNEPSRIFLRGLNICYNPFITFGIKQIPSTVGIVGAENPWHDLFTLTDELNDRTLSGHAARDAVAELSLRFNSDEWNDFVAPILRRDMRSGISEKTVNKIVKGTEFEIPMFGCQLATNCEGRPEMRGIKRLEPKLDGVRVLIFVTFPDYGNTRVVCYSRNGKVFENFRHIEEQIEANAFALVNAMPARVSGFVLDGEIVGESFQALMKQVQRKEDVQNEDSVFHVFDVIPEVNFLEGHYNAQLSRRLQVLEKMRPIIDNMPNVELLPYKEVDLDTDTGKQEFHHYCADMVALGYEGVMIKSLDAPYLCSRSTAWCKWKPIITVDLKIVGIQKGTGRNINTMGALVCEGTDDDKFIQVNVGSGFTDTQRSEFWVNRTQMIGRTVEVIADAITQNQNLSYSLRFPRFLRFRDDL